MAIIVPTGSPAWVRDATHETYGGALEKANYQSTGTIDPQTDFSAENWARTSLDMAACERTAPAMMLRYQCNDTPHAPPTIIYARSMWGSTGTYEGDNPPVGFPSAIRNDDSDVTFILEDGQTLPDAYGVRAGWSSSNAAANNLTVGAWVNLQAVVPLALLPPCWLARILPSDENGDLATTEDLLCEVVFW